VRAVCQGCRVDTFLHPYHGGWICPDCRHVTGTTAPPPPKQKRYDRNFTPLPDHEAISAVEMYRQGATIEGIAKHLHRSRRRISITLDLYGVERRPTGFKRGELREVCRNGLHPMTHDNIVYEGGETRRCRACRRLSHRVGLRRWRQRQKAA
jgi:hypothetical protein